MFCSKCGKEIREDANFCMYCGAPVDKNRNDAKIGKTGEALTFPVAETEYDKEEYSNCENGKVSFEKMFRNFFSKNIKYFFRFERSDSRLEHFYTKLIIYIALLAVGVPFSAVPPLYIIIAIPLTVSFFWLMLASTCRRLNDLHWNKKKFFIAMFIGAISTPFIIGDVIVLYLWSVLYFYKKAEDREEDGLNDKKTNKEEREDNDNENKKDEKNEFTFKDVMAFVAFIMMISGIIAFLSIR